MMEQIRRDLRQRHPHSAAARVQRPSVDEVLARARAELARRHRPEGVSGVAASVAGSAAMPWHPAAERLPGKREYLLAELLKFADADFIEVVYRILLRRSPDP